MDYKVCVSASQVHQQAKHPNIQVVDFRASDESTDSDWAQLNQSAIQIWAIPPRRKKNSEEQYLRIVQDWIAGLDSSRVEKIIFLSSTSVYANVSAVVDERSTINDDSLMAKAEAIVAASPVSSIILRLGGLMGGDRYVAKYFSGKRNDGANCPVNYVHKDDVVNLIALACEKIQAGIYNIVAPEHPTKQDVGMNDCEKRGMNPGYWDSSQPCLGGKIVSGDKIVEELSYDFKWPDPMEF